MGKEEFFDEQIIDMMNKAEQKKESSKVNQSETVEERNIYTGVRIFGKWIYFERSLLAKDTITMMLPKNFVPLGPDMTKNKYPSEHRPETILTDETGTINLMFQYMEGEVSDATIENFRNQIFGMMKRVNPGIRNRFGGCFREKDCLCGVFKSCYGREIIQSYVLFGSEGTTIDGKF